MQTNTFKLKFGSLSPSVTLKIRSRSQKPNHPRSLIMILLEIHRRYLQFCTKNDWSAVKHSNYWNDLKTHRFLFVCFQVWRENSKIENHYILLPVHKDYFCSKLNWLASLMRKIWGQKWQNHNFGDKTVLKNLFSLDLVYMWSLDASNQESKSL